jgi:hypothetical protein
MLELLPRRSLGEITALYKNFPARIRERQKNLKSWLCPLKFLKSFIVLSEANGFLLVKKVKISAPHKLK